jgi:hypothetical protein
MGVTISQKPPDSDIWWIFINYKGRPRTALTWDKNLEPALLTEQKYNKLK